MEEYFNNNVIEVEYKRPKTFEEEYAEFMRKVEERKRYLMMNHSYRPGDEYYDF